MKAILASRNPHKARELREILPEWEIEPVDAELPPEEGSTFYENARGKARFAQAEAAPGAWTLGEDSGLEVEALDGAPGIRSARYAGPGATDEENLARLLAHLRGVEGDGRRARYVCEMVLLSPAGEERRATGTLAGRIAEAPRGSAGFGYDPVFLPDGEALTVAELGDEWKREHSHRARAARALQQLLAPPGRASARPPGGP